jgi:GTP-binding protein Era
MAYRAGTVALIGKPNVGKSTLLNHIVGQKVSIVSNKPQTTRRRVLGIATTEEWQIAFIDTPGIHAPHSILGRAMVEQARSALSDVDLIVYVADGSHHPGEEDKTIAKMLPGTPSSKADDASSKSIPIILCLNKMDMLKAENVQRNVDAYTALFGTEDYMMTVATTGMNVPKLIDKIVESLPERAPIYDEDEYTDQSSRFMAAEFIREKILQATRQEIPHATAVSVDHWEDEGQLTRIDATILVEKGSQRGILIGKQGAFLKNIGTRAREDLEATFGRKVFLQLHVKVAENWRMNPRILHELDYE